MATFGQWNEVAGKAHATVRGHYLAVLFEGDRWLKWVDGHFRGSVGQLETAKEQLEREAAGEGDAWGTK